MHGGRDGGRDGAAELPTHGGRGTHLCAPPPAQVDEEEMRKQQHEIAAIMKMREAASSGTQVGVWGVPLTPTPWSMGMGWDGDGIRMDTHAVLWHRAEVGGDGAAPGCWLGPAAVLQQHAGCAQSCSGAAAEHGAPPRVCTPPILQSDPCTTPKRCCPSCTAWAPTATWW